MKLILRLADHDTETGQSRTLETGRLSIGRGPENDWVLADPDRTLSKNHCRIDASEGGFMLTDLSTNGVFLSGASSPIGRGQSCALEHGDSIALGPYRMQAEISGADGMAAHPGGLALPQSEVDAIFLGGTGRPPPIAPTIPEGWAADMPSGGFGPDRRAAPEGWDAPPDPATYAASGLFEQPATPGDRRLPDHPFTAAVSLFATQSEHIPASGTVMRVPESQVVLPTNWNDIDPMESMSARPASAQAAAPQTAAPQTAAPQTAAPQTAALPGAALQAGAPSWPPTLPPVADTAPEPAAASWPPALPEEPPPPPSLPPDWVLPEAGTPGLPETWQSAPSPPPAAAARPVPVPVPPRPDPVVLAPVPPPSPIPAPRPPAPAAPLAAAVRPAPRPVRPAVPQTVVAPPAPAPAALPVADERSAPATPDALVRALLEGAGLPPEAVQDADPVAAMREIGQMIRAAVEGVRDIMSTRALVKSEFRVDQTVLKRSDNNAVKFAPDVQRCLAAMVGEPPPGFLPGPAAMQQALDDIKAHELALVAALNSVFADMDQQLDPEAITRRARQDTGLSTMLPYAREARCWAIYVETHRLLRDSGAANTGGSLLAPLAHAYGRQLRRGV